MAAMAFWTAPAWTAPILAAPGAQPAAPPPDIAPCEVTPTVQASPSTVVLGQAVAVTVTVASVCPDYGEPVAADSLLHIALVVDGSRAMAGEPGRLVEREVRGLVDRLDLDNRPNIKIGVVMFDLNARTLCQLTNAGAQVKGCIGRIGETGDGACLDCGLREAARMLMSGRGRAPAGSDIREIVLLATNSTNVAGCAPVAAAARQLENQKVTVMTACAGRGCDLSCLRQVATSPSVHQAMLDTDRLFSINPGSNIVSCPIYRPVPRLTTTVVLDRRARLVADTVAPAAEVGPGGSHVTWRDDLRQRREPTYVFEVVPRALGEQPLFREGSVGIAEVGYGVGRVQNVALPAPRVRVVAP